MLAELIPVYLYVTSVVVGVIVWAVRQEGRITAVKELNDQRAENMEKIVNVQLASIDARLERIERGLNGALRRN